MKKESKEGRKEKLKDEKKGIKKEDHPKKFKDWMIKTIFLNQKKERKKERKKEKYSIP